MSLKILSGGYAVSGFNCDYCGRDTDPEEPSSFCRLYSAGESGTRIYVCRRCARERRLE